MNRLKALQTILKHTATTLKNKPNKRVQQAYDTLKLYLEQAGSINK